MAEDAAVLLSAGQTPQSVIPTTIVDMSRRLVLYIIVFDDSGELIVSSVQLDGRTPAVPAGVFDYVREHGEDRFTWQPKEGVRSAAVVSRYTGERPGFVLAGRSLREVEKREDVVRTDIGLLCLATLGVTLIVSVAANRT